ncbi:MAG: lactate racemase domain-containing protein [Candidatus Binataceae bacterium]
MELLQQYGVRPEDIQIKVANALHRMWTRKEMTHILGPRLPYPLGGRLSCIDATDINQFANLGITKRGMEVTDVKGQTDVLLIGMADGDSYSRLYSRLSVFNPIHCRNKALVEGLPGGGQEAAGRRYGA